MPTPLPKPFTFVIPPVADILGSDLPPTDWILPDRVAVGDHCILGGRPFSGKSWLLYELALAWAAGQRAFNWAPAFSRQRVLLIDEENSREEGWSRVRDIAHAMDVSPADLQDTFMYPLPRSGFSFSRPTNYAALIKLIEDFSPKWVLIDSLVGVLRVQDENASASMRNFYNDLVKPLCAERGVGLVFLHHTRKSSTETGAVKDYGDFENLRGSGDLAAASDSILMCWREAHRTTLHSAKARRNPDFGNEPPPDLLITLETINGGRRPVVDATRFSPQQADSATLADAIVDLLGAAGSPLPAQELLARLRLAGRLDFGRSAFYAALARLEKGGKVLSANEKSEKVLSLPAQP